MRIRQNLIVCALKSFPFKNVTSSKHVAEMKLPSFHRQKAFLCNFCVYKSQLHVSSEFCVCLCCRSTLHAVILCVCVCVSFVCLFVVITVRCCWRKALNVYTGFWNHFEQQRYFNYRAVGFLCCCHIFYDISLKLILSMRNQHKGLVHHREKKKIVGCEKCFWWLVLTLSNWTDEKKKWNRKMRYCEYRGIHSVLMSICGIMINKRTEICFTITIKIVEQIKFKTGKINISALVSSCVHQKRCK